MPSIIKIIAMPNNPDHLVVCNRSKNLYIITTDGSLVRTYTSDLKNATDFVALAVSSHGDYIYGATESGRVCCFMASTGSISMEFSVSKTSEIINMAHHTFANIMAVTTDDGIVTLWK